MKILRNKDEKLMKKRMLLLNKDKDKAMKRLSKFAIKMYLKNIAKMDRLGLLPIEKKTIFESFVDAFIESNKDKYTIDKRLPKEVKANLKKLLAIKGEKKEDIGYIG